MSPATHSSWILTMLARSLLSETRVLARLALVAAVLLALLGSAPVRADVVFGTLNTAENGSGFGSFDIANPTGSPGSYSYAWTTVLSNQDALADLARDPDSGEMYLMVDPYGTKSYRSITTTGSMTSLGTPAVTIYSMAIDAPRAQ